MDTQFDNWNDISSRRYESWIPEVSLKVRINAQATTNLPSRISPLSTASFMGQERLIPENEICPRCWPFFATNDLLYRGEGGLEWKAGLGLLIWWMVTRVKFLGTWASLHSNIPGSTRRPLRILWRIQIVIPRLYSVPCKPFPRVFHVQWKMKPDPVYLTDLSRGSTRFIARPSPAGVCSLLATLRAPTPLEFLFLVRDSSKFNMPSAGSPYPGYRTATVQSDVERWLGDSCCWLPSRGINFVVVEDKGLLRNCNLVKKRYLLLNLTSKYSLFYSICGSVSQPFLSRDFLLNLIR